MFSLALLFEKPINVLLRSTNSVLSDEHNAPVENKEQSAEKHDEEPSESTAELEIEVVERASSVHDLEDCSPLCAELAVDEMTDEPAEKSEEFTTEVSTNFSETLFPDKSSGLPESSVSIMQKEFSVPNDLKRVASVSMEDESSPVKEFLKSSQANSGRTNRLSNSVWIKPLDTDNDEGSDTPPRRTSPSNIQNFYRASRSRHGSKPSRTYYLSSPSRCVTREGSPVPSNYNMNVVPNALSKLWKVRGDNAIIAIISALYAKLLVVVGLAFPMTEVISSHVTSASYLGFYLYLYFGCIVYILYVFFTMMRNKAAKSSSSNFWRKGKHKPPNSPEAELEDDVFGEVVPSETNTFPSRLTRTCDAFEQRHASVYSNSSSQHHGSFYLRVGAVAFGVGSMIYSGLEFAQYFETNLERNCRDVLLAVTPAARMVFTFSQMYFIFLNAKMAVYCRPRVIAYFGLMHMVATNLCVWLNVIIEETKHEILQHFSLDTHSGKTEGSHGGQIITKAVQWALKNRNRRDYTNGYKSADLSGRAHFESSTFEDECKRSDMMGNVVQESSQFLFPCAIEYSLICAAILYVMWKKAVTGFDADERYQRTNSSVSSAVVRKARHQYTVDCAKANKGLFAGLFVLVLTIISVIVFFALISNPNYREIALMEVGLARLLLFCLAFFATIIGIYQVRELGYDSSRHFGLDAVLLVVAQVGLVAYKIFTFIACCYTTEYGEASILVLLGAVAAIMQAVTQTLFILDASRRHTYSADQQSRKPGREVVTFLLMCNFAMWVVNSLEKSRSDVNPLQQHFYGLWPWIIIMNVSMPLTIFYRFHSTVILCEIWKRCYKAKPDLVA